MTEEAVFSNNGITLLMNNTSMQKLHQRLVAKPSLCQYINEINLEMPFNADMELVVSIMRKVMDRNVKLITGGASLDSEIYGLLFGIAKESELKLARVEVVPTPSEFGDLYCRVLRIFKKSLKRMLLLFERGKASYMESIWSDLKEFESLEHISLQNLHFRDLMQLDSFLDRATCKSLKLIISASSINDAPVEKEAMNHWCQVRRMKQVHTVKSMHLIPYRATFGLAIILFVLYKFPKLEFLRITEVDCSPYFETLFEAIKHIPSLDLECKFTGSAGALRWIELLRGPHNSISLKCSRRAKRTILKA